MCNRFLERYRETGQRLGIDLPTHVSENRHDNVEAGRGMRIPQEIKRSQFDRRYFHRTRIRLVIYNPSGKSLDLLSVVEGDGRMPNLHFWQSLCGNHLKFVHRLMRSAMQLCRLEQSDVI